MPRFLHAHLIKFIALTVSDTSILMHLPEKSGCLLLVKIFISSGQSTQLQSHALNFFFGTAAGEGVTFDDCFFLTAFGVLGFMVGDDFAMTEIKHRRPYVDSNKKPL